MFLFPIEDDDDDHVVSPAISRDTSATSREDTIAQEEESKVETDDKNESEDALDEADENAIDEASEKGDVQGVNKEMDPLLQKFTFF